MHNQGASSATGTKEALSVYGLFRKHAHTSQGKTLLRKCFLRPSLNIDVIEERLETVSTLLHPQNLEALDILISNIRLVADMHIAVNKLKKGASMGANRAFGVSKSIWVNIRQVGLSMTCSNSLLTYD